MLTTAHRSAVSPPHSYLSSIHHPLQTPASTASQSPEPEGRLYALQSPVTPLAVPSCGHSPTRRLHRRRSREQTLAPAPAAGSGRSRAGCCSPTPSARLRLRPPSPSLSSLATPWARLRRQRRSPRRCAGTGARRW